MKYPNEFDATKALQQHHDLLNGIAVVNVYVELLREERLTPDQHEMIAEIGEATTRAHQLAEELGAAVQRAAEKH